MSQTEEQKIIETPYFTNDAKILMLLYIKPRKYYDLQKMGFSSSVIYRVIKDFIIKEFIIEEEDKSYKITEKGKLEAEKLIKCIRNF